MKTKNRRICTEFGMKAKMKMIEKNMTNKELAERVGCQPSYLTDIFTGCRSGEKYLNKIHKILGIEKCEFEEYLYRNG
jgi:transcriptional regulator with XRE-family HTH domain